MEWGYQDQVLNRCELVVVEGGTGVGLPGSGSEQVRTSVVVEGGNRSGDTRIRF